jgi:hypothetical protein
MLVLSDSLCQVIAFFVVVVAIIGLQASSMATILDVLVEYIIGETSKKKLPLCFVASQTQ